MQTITQCVTRCLQKSFFLKRYICYGYEHIMIHRDCKKCTTVQSFKKLIFYPVFKNFYGHVFRYCGKISTQ